ncbi:MAG: GNAT family N-acetyltransferase [Alphaproteobacteria bacterium]|jgi:CelD/BcsL family acetyltransferase involved in cellulose biosynthesis|uniref:GNAT family N-acetyltransferase n=1 Tax=Maricaulis alexandrii TaxID=2570354 RepID=UPI001486A181|nr:GNAT family N-acetyltransferase [Maricaulis alexandrii]MCR9267898.1 GNAT family N-acetyltransferase [Alphaproteobacteria bacterium]
MQVELKKPSALTTAEREAWRAFTDADPALGSPYFTYEFAECCEEARSDTRVLVMRDAGAIKAFLPIQTGHFGYARPLAGPLGDVQGVIAEPDWPVDLAAALKAAHIPVFDFHAALASQPAFREHTDSTEGSWMIDLSDGFDAWYENRKSVEAKAMRNVRTRYNRLEKISDDHAFVMADNRPEALEAMIAWKRAQYAETGVFDVFSVAWTRRLLQAVLKRESDHFSGMCSTLQIDGKIAAVHVGMSSHRQCQFWFPAFDRDYNQVSPGLLMLVETARTCASLGLSAIELGPGDFRFKKDLSSYQIGIAAGHFSNPSVMGLLRDGSAALVRRLDGEPQSALSRLTGKAMRKIDRLAGFYAA